MDDIASRRQSTLTNRSSGIPRPSSKLPLPKPSGIPAPKGIRPAASRESLRASTTVSDLRSSTSTRLRTSVSRDQLNGPSLRKPPSTTKLQTASRDSSEQRNGPNDSRLKRHVVPIPKRRESAQVVPVSVPVFEEEDGPENELPYMSREDGATFDSLRSQPRKSRLSLSERTIETLSALPSSPAFKRRGSNFFVDADGFKRPASRSGSNSRPGSSYQSDGSMSRPLSRPGSSSGPSDSLHSNSRASTNSYKPPLSTVQGTPTKRTSSMAKTPTMTKTPTMKPSSASSKLQSNASLSASMGPRTPSPEKDFDPSVSKYGSKTMTARALKPRASVNGLFKKPSMPALVKPTSTNFTSSDLSIRPVPKISVPSIRYSITSSEDRNLSSASTVSTALTVDSAEEAPQPASRKSSAALREQIAKAKAAKRAANKQASGSAMPKSPLVPTDASFDFGDFGLSDDPFGQKQFENTNRKVMQSRIGQARTTGRLNIAAMGLKEIPEEVVKMYDLASIGGHGAAWAESVDLTRFVAADNELETIDDSIFPDADPSDMADDEDSRGHQFGGLETLDLHGNMLYSLPIGLRRLQLLTSLNLASNKLANNCIDVISQVAGLRDLKLGKNLLYGPMDPCFSKLENLEILDLNGNNITALPEGLENLTRLRILNINENAFESLPFKSLSMLPLTELMAHKNKLRGTLMDSQVESLSQLQILDVSANQLTLLFPTDAPSVVAMPALHQLNLSMNRIQALPNISSWKSLLSLTADENSIAAIPDGFTSLENLRNVDFTSNDIRIIPPEIARMDGLAMLRITGNPLRDKKFTSLTTEELKANLAARLEPAPGEQDVGIMQNFGNGFHPSGAKSLASSQNEKTSDSSEAPPVNYDDQDGDSRSDNDDFATPPTSVPGTPFRSRSNTVRSRSQTLSSQTWPIKTGGLLDRSNTQSSSLHPVVCSKIAAEQTIREIRLQHNTFTTLPNSLSFFADTLTTLSMSHNQLVGEGYLTEELDLTALTELNVSNNFITSLMPLVTHLRAPNLQKLDCSFNRIVDLPPALRDYFPSLSVLLISNNHLQNLPPESIRGLKVVNAENNDIAHLDPRLGLLGGTGLLERLDVMGNRFRVPRFNVLERGTDATLRWLRGRVPVAEMAEWRAKAGNVDEDVDDID